MTTYHWTADRLVHYPLIEHVDLAPDGQAVLFTIRTAHMTDEASEFRPQIMHAPTDGRGGPVPLTFGRGAAQPRWHPDGHLIAFLRRGEGDEAPVGLWAMRANGGEPWPLTGEANGVRHDILDFRWSPDGRRIAFRTVPWDAEKEARRKRRDDVTQWREEYDFVHLHCLDVAVAPDPLPPVTQLTHGRLSVEGYGWHPDSRRLALTHQPAPLFDFWTEMRLATIAADGSETEPTDVAHVGSWMAAPFYAPDGRWIACQVGNEEKAWAYTGRATLFPTDGGAPVSLADVPDEQPQIIGWAPDSSALYVLDQLRLCSQIVALPVDGSAGRVLVSGERLITLAETNGQGHVAFVGQNFDTPTSVFVAPLAEGGDEARLVAAPPLPEGWAAGPLPQLRLLRWQSDDGSEIEGILYLPASYDEESGARIPLLLHVHGGPASVFQRQYAATPYYYTPAALCERGIAVLRCNPRGSGGYGREFRFANRRDWGGGDYRDLMRGVDTVIEMGIADPARLGVCGWSYGGFMTSWTITQTNRFRAASIGAAVTNPMSFNGTADIPSFIPDYFQAEFWEDPDIYRDRSPIFQAGTVATPAIIQHGAEDARVPLEQGLQFYNAMRRRGVPVQMFIYPRQGHAIQEPRLLADAARRNLDWFTEMLAPDEGR